MSKTMSMLLIAVICTATLAIRDAPDQSRPSLQLASPYIVSIRGAQTQVYLANLCHSVGASYDGRALQFDLSAVNGPWNEFFYATMEAHYAGTGSTGELFCSTADNHGRACSNLFHAAKGTQLRITVSVPNGVAEMILAVNGAFLPAQNGQHNSTASTAATSVNIKAPPQIVNGSFVPASPVPIELEPFFEFSGTVQTSTSFPDQKTLSVCPPLTGGQWLLTASVVTSEFYNDAGFATLLCPFTPSPCWPGSPPAAVDESGSPINVVRTVIPANWVPQDIYVSIYGWGNFGTLNGYNGGIRCSRVV